MFVASVQRALSRVSARVATSGGHLTLSSLSSSTTPSTGPCSCCHRPCLHQSGHRRLYSSTSQRQQATVDEDAPAAVHISIQEAQETTAKALQNLGWDEQDAALQAEIMVAAELCGNNQGMLVM